MRAELVLVGTELLLGDIVDTNGPYLARLLAESGIDLFRTVLVGDNPARVEAAVREAAQRADLVIMTGGLGPTVDDLTSAAIAAAFDLPVVENSEALALVKAVIESRHREMDERQAKQALFPLGARPLVNPVGTAPGIFLTHGGKTVIALPGVPSEMKAIMEGLRVTLAGMGSGEVMKSRVFHSAGVGEPEIDRRLGGLWHNPNPTVGVLAGSGQVNIRLTAKGTPETCDQLLAEFGDTVLAVLGDCVYGEGEATLEQAAVAGLMARGATLATAESCTGGLISDRLTDVPGASSVLERGFVVYSNRAKEELLGVDPTLLAQHGAVSEEVARAMAEGARRAASTTVAIAVTGIAGPGGGSDAKPVGLVHMALAAPDGTWHRVVHLGTERRTNKVRAAGLALLFLLDYLHGRLV